MYSYSTTTPTKKVISKSTPTPKAKTRTRCTQPTAGTARRTAATARRGSSRSPACTTDTQVATPGSPERLGEGCEVNEGCEVKGKEAWSCTSTTTRGRSIVRPHAAAAVPLRAARPLDAVAAAATAAAAVAVDRGFRAARPLDRHRPR